MLQKLFSELPVFLRFFVNLTRSAAKQHLSAHAAGICFFLLLALFPMAILTCTFLRAVGFLPADLLRVLVPLLPNALLPLTRQLIEGFFAARSVAALSATALAAFWSASRGIYGIMLGLNGVGGFSDHRGFIRRRLICLAYLALAVLGLPAVLAAHMMGYTLLRSGSLFSFLRYLIAFGILALLLTGIYFAFPAETLRLRICLICGCLSALLWAGFTAAFSLYASTANAYSTFYGSLRWIALGLLWLYFCMMILLFGGALCAELHRRLLEPNSNL